MNIVFAVLDQEIKSLGRDALINSSASKYKKAEKDDWKALEMPEKHDVFSFNRQFSDSQMESLRFGNIPQEMEDKWFWYMVGNKLYAHRSWTGLCIFIIEFGSDGHHVVTVNRNPEQYSCTSVDEDCEKINKLLDWWTQPAYDHYGEWLAETVDTLKKAGKIKDKLDMAGKEVDAVFFHKPEEPNGFLSNWFISPFDLNGIHFSSAEQFIMYRKCMLFGDESSAKAVLATDDPATQQDIGRKAKGYIGTVWSGARQMVAFEGLLAKFSQNEDLKNKLIDTDDAVLVECAGSDKIWACGIRLDDERRFNASEWIGQNILGYTLMTVRDFIRKESK